MILFLPHSLSCKSNIVSHRIACLDQHYQVIMSKLRFIETTLKEIDQAKFHSLCDAYLHRRGYEHINPIGRVIGADKVRKGTPDTLISLPNGKFIFAEYTTQQTGVSEKFLKDLDKCFEESKTGVAVEQIQEIIFCHNIILDAAEINLLEKKCNAHNCKLEIFGVAAIALDLFQKYPGLAEEFLGIKVDTRQIITPDEFVLGYNRNSFATPLNTKFHFKQQELDKSLETLEDHDLLIISGRSGVGKSRLALECVTNFLKSHPDFESYCVRNLNADLYDDIQVYFRPDGKRLVVVDDANRMISGLEYLLYFLNQQTEHHKIKIIVTVRDYALDKIRDVAKTYGGGSEFEVAPFSDEEIKDFVKSEFGIQNFSYLTRIADIAKGNPRIAVMAARIAAKENNLQSINDVSALYDEYFSSIRKDFSDLGNTNLLKAAGIITFFRVLDRTNIELMDSINSAFGLTTEDIWQAVDILHEIEVVDKYEDEVVRISDQVLATYLFYLAFFKERKLSFSILLNHFFPSFKHKIIDAINPILNVFDFKDIKNELRPHIESSWNNFQAENNEEFMYQLMRMFWFLKETEILLHLKKQINALERNDTEISSLSFQFDENAPVNNLLSLIRLFRDAEPALFKIALALLIDYLDKCPKEVSSVLHILCKDFGFRETSHLQIFTYERIVIDLLWEYAKNGANRLGARVFLAIAEQFLNTHFHRVRSSSNAGISMVDFSLVASDELLEIRRDIWQRVLSLYQIPEFQEAILSLLHSHRKFQYYSCDKKILKGDSTPIITFFEDHLDHNSYSHCLIVQDFLDTLRGRKIRFNKSTQARFTNEAYRLSNLLLIDKSEWSSLSWEKYEGKKLKQLKVLVAEYTQQDYKKFLHLCKEIFGNINRDFGLHPFQNRIKQVLLNLAEENPALYLEVLKDYFQSKDPLALSYELYDCRLVEKLIKIAGIQQTQELLQNSTYALSKRWLASYLLALPESSIGQESLMQLYDFYRQSEFGELPMSLDFLIKYEGFDQNVFISITEILVDKANQDNNYGRYLTDFFNDLSVIGRRVKDIFANQINLLKQAYFVTLKIERHFDYDGFGFNLLLDLDKQFAAEYIAWMFQTHERVEGVGISNYQDLKSYDFIWKRDDYAEI